MATVNLLPNADISTTMSYSTGSDAYALLDDDHTGNQSTDSSYMHTTTVGHSTSVAFQDFSESASSIDAVQVVAKMGNNGRGASFTAGMTIEDGSGTLWAEESTGSLAASLGYRTVTFTNRTTSNGSDAWEESDINDLRVAMRLNANSAGTFRYTYCYVIVTYTEAVATDNSILFGTNF